MTKREFAIKLGKMVVEALEAGLDQEHILSALQEQVVTESRLKGSRRKTELSY